MCIHMYTYVYTYRTVTVMWEQLFVAGTFWVTGRQNTLAQSITFRVLKCINIETIMSE
jgi:hypothetical protein